METTHIPAVVYRPALRNEKQNEELSHGRQVSGHDSNNTTGRYEIVEVFAEHTRDGTPLERPAFVRLLGFLEQRHERVFVLIDHPERVTRNMAAAGEIMHAITRRGGMLPNTIVNTQLLAHELPLRPTPAATARKRSACAPTYALTISLEGTRPRIWRRVLVAADMPLPELHAVLQAVMGWKDYHYHSFRSIDGEYGEPDSDESWFDLGLVDEGKARLRDLAPRGCETFMYEYDFGDRWVHRVEVRRYEGRALPLPSCTSGRRACPPEDCGGVGGYAEFLAAIADPDHEDHVRLTSWAGGSFNAERFDLAEVNDALSSIAT